MFCAFKVYAAEFQLQLSAVNLEKQQVIDFTLLDILTFSFIVICAHPQKEKTVAYRIWAEMGNILNQLGFLSLINKSKND